MLNHHLKLNKFYQKWFVKNRLVIVNETNFEEIFSLKLNLINVFVLVSFSAILLICFTTFIIAFTPLRELIPGYPSTKLKKEATAMALKSDSLSKELEQNKNYIKSIQKVLTGQLEYAKYNKDSILNHSEINSRKQNLEVSFEELELRKNISNEEKKTKNKN